MLNLIFAPWAAKTLYCAVRLKVFNHLAEKSKTADQLAAKTNAVPRVLPAVLDACVSMGFLEKKNNRYRNSSLSQLYLVEGNPLYLGDIIEVLSTEASGWDDLYGMVTGAGESTPLKPEHEVPPHRFTMAMNNLAMMGEAGALAEAAVLDDARSMVDVGCGSGIYSVFLCRRFPGLHAELLDRGEVLETTGKIIKKANLGHRVSTREADITEDSFGSRLDVVLLSDVLYQEEAVCTGILRSAYRALVPGGTLLVRGYYSDAHPDGSQSVFGALFNIHQLMFDPRREIISISLLSEWIKRAGFNLTKTFPLTERSYCLTAVRPKSTNSQKWAAPTP
ncbi:MAG: methyltransferase domain-containing protein [bacterium]|nr:methyltransferase domain-containing protein [bacterium]